MLLQLGAFLFAPRHLGFHLQIDSLQFQFMGAPGQFLKFPKQRLNLDLNQIGLDLVCQVVMRLGLGQAGSAGKQGGQGQPGDDGGGCLFFHFFTG